jgi:hypothetical protein
MKYSKQLPVAKKYDVVVCGCGVAGFTAAVQAGRLGASVCLIEDTGMPGGILTFGGNNEIALFNAGSKPVIRGIGWEFVQRLSEAGYADIPHMDEDIHHSLQGVHVNIPMAAHLMDEMLLEAGVDILYNQRIVDSVVENNTVIGVVVSTKQGLILIKGTQFIDCTGDGDVAYFSGAEYEIGDELQPGTLRFYPTGYDIEDIDRDAVIQDLRHQIQKGEIKREDFWSGLHAGYGAFSKQGNNINHVNINNADSDSRSQAEIEGRRSIARLYKWMKSQDGAESLEILSCASNVAARESRRIVCNTYINVDDYISGRKYPDSICYSYYPIDLHTSGDETLHNIYLEKGCLPTIPLSALQVKGFDNLMVAGRCVGGDRLANSAFRVKASCMAMGQSAGAAAALACQQSLPNNKVDIDDIKAALLKHNAIIPE